MSIRVLLLFPQRGQNVAAKRCADWQALPGKNFLGARAGFGEERDVKKRMAVPSLGFSA
jgi:hypothetical protein